MGLFLKAMTKYGNIYLKSTELSEWVTFCQYSTLARLI